MTTEEPTTAEPPGLAAALQKWWKQPPRRHGEIIADRSVGNLELFYDLVYVVLISRASHTLVEHLTLRGVVDFAIMFALLLNAWQNGSLFHDLHGRDDGRSRNLIFVQMSILVILSIFTGGAFTTDGRAFALTYALLFVLLCKQWWRVRRLDEPQYKRITGRYLLGVIVIILLMGGSAWASTSVRFWIWLFVALLVTVGVALSTLASHDITTVGFVVTEAFAERMGLFVIIVLGETVVGVSAGLLDAHDRTTMPFIVGLLTLQLAFGFWWTYFDTTRGLVPRHSVRAITGWLALHVPLTGAIAASGAAMVVLIEHAEAARAPVAAARTLGFGTAAVLICTALVGLTLQDPRMESVRKTVAGTYLVGAATAAFVGFLPLPPWAIALLLAAATAGPWVSNFVLIATRVPRTSLVPRG